MIHKNVAVYIWFQLCKILTDFNNFCSAETGKIYKTEHAFTYLLLKESVANDVLNVSFDQSVVNHAIDEWRRRVSACVDTEGGHFERYLWLLLSK